MGSGKWMIFVLAGTFWIIVSWDMECGISDLLMTDCLDNFFPTSVGTCVTNASLSVLSVLVCLYGGSGRPVEPVLKAPSRAVSQSVSQSVDDVHRIQRIRGQKGPTKPKDRANNAKETFLNNSICRTLNASTLYRGQNPQNREKRVSGSKNSHFPVHQKRAL